MQNTIAGTSRARVKKLNPRNNLPIVRESALDLVDEHIARQGQNAETGVEKSEETEFHLQAALRSQQAVAAGQDVKKQEIPTRKAYRSDIAYDTLYASQYKQPTTYVRFSSTVEDCVGCSYDMDKDDRSFLAEMNAKTKDSARRCSDYNFERVMHAISEAGQEHRISLEMIQNKEVPMLELDFGMEESKHAAGPINIGLVKQICGHFYQRVQKAHSGLRFRADLKFETGAETDDGDPYVCFRRRELRQTRKTRGRDAHSVEKLRRLRRELEEARDILALIKQRENAAYELLKVDRKLFEERASLRSTKRSLPESYRANDNDLLLTHKKRKVLDQGQTRRAGSNIRMVSNNGRSSDQSMVTLAEVLKLREKDIQSQIEAKIQQHRRWNEGYVDLTVSPLTAEREAFPESTFCTASTEYLPTPPASVSSEHSAGHQETGEALDETNSYVLEHYAKARPRLAFRRRYGRGGRLFIDRKLIGSANIEDRVDSPIGTINLQEDEDDDEQAAMPNIFDPYDDDSVHFRASLFHTSQQQNRQAQATKILPPKTQEVAVR